MILLHSGWHAEGRGDHWDWMLEPPNDSLNGLLTFSSQDDPRLFSALWLLEVLPPHRLEYLTYEGPVSQDRGQVQRVASGLIRWIEFGTHAATFELMGMEFFPPPSAGWPTGQYFLTRLPSENRWQMSRHKESP